MIHPRMNSFTTGIITKIEIISIKSGGYIHDSVINSNAKLICNHV